MNAKLINCVNCGQLTISLSSFSNSIARTFEDRTAGNGSVIRRARKAIEARARKEQQDLLVTPARLYTRDAGMAAVVGYLYKVTVNPFIGEGETVRIEIKIEKIKKFFNEITDKKDLKKIKGKIEEFIGFFEDEEGIQYIIETTEIAKIIEEIEKLYDFHGLTIGPFNEEGLLKPPFRIDEPLFFLFFEVYDGNIEYEYIYDPRKIILNMLFSESISFPLL